MLAQQRALQLQERHLAIFYAVGPPQESRRRAPASPPPRSGSAPKARSRITTAGLLNDRGELAAAAEHLAEAEALLHRGIAWGFADPWSMLGFQGLYPLFQSREDAIHDPRVDELLSLVGDLLEAIPR